MSTIAQVLSFVALVGNAGVIVAMADGAVTAPAPIATQSAIPEVDPFFMLSGALLKDSFDRPQLDTKLWSRMENGFLPGPNTPCGSITHTSSSKWM